MEYDYDYTSESSLSQTMVVSDTTELDTDNDSKIILDSNSVTGKTIGDELGFAYHIYPSCYTTPPSNA